MSNIQTQFGAVSPAHFHSGGTSPRSCAIGPKFLYAMYNPDEAFHEIAYAFLTFVRNDELPYRRFVVNEHSIDEAATRLKKRGGMNRAKTFLKGIAGSEHFDIVSLSENTFEAVRDRFVAWDDNSASFTDFAIGVQMEHHNLDHVMTFDSDLTLFDVNTYPELEEV